MAAGNGHLWAPSRPWFLFPCPTTEGSICVLTKGRADGGFAWAFPPQGLAESQFSTSLPGIGSFHLLTPLSKEPHRHHFLQEAFPDQSQLGLDLPYLVIASHHI